MERTSSRRIQFASVSKHLGPHDTLTSSPPIRCAPFDALRPLNGCRGEYHSAVKHSRRKGVRTTIRELHCRHCPASRFANFEKLVLKTCVVEPNARGQYYRRPSDSKWVLNGNRDLKEALEKWRLVEAPQTQTQTQTQPPPRTQPQPSPQPHPQRHSHLHPNVHMQMRTASSQAEAPPSSPQPQPQPQSQPHIQPKLDVQSWTDCRRADAAPQPQPQLWPQARLQRDAQTQTRPEVEQLQAFQMQQEAFNARMWAAWQEVATTMLRVEQRVEALRVEQQKRTSPS
eukprot:jgi/Chlat1/6254/Chrsp44S05771